MRNLILLLALFTTLSCDQTGSEESAAEGSSAAESNKSLKNGLISTTNAATKVKNEVTYKDGMRHGPAKAYYPSGKIWKENNYVDGKLDGIARIYFRNGKPKRESHYKVGNRDGKYTEFFKSGNPKLEIVYDNEKPLLGYKDRNYKGELEPYPTITYSENENYADNGVKEVFVRAQMALADGSSPKALQLFLFPKEVDWNTSSLEELEEYRMRPSGQNEAFIKISLEPGQFMAIDGKIVAIFDLKKGLPVAYDQDLRLSFENL